MKKLKSFMCKIVIVFCMFLAFGTLGSSNVLAQGDDQYTKLLMHMDEGNFKDECGHTGINDVVTVDNSNKKFGEGSFYFNGKSSFVQVSNPEDFYVSKEDDATYDFWVKRSSIGGYQEIFAQIDSKLNYQNCGFFSVFLPSNELRFGFYDNSGVDHHIDSTTIFTNTTTFNHIALIKENNILKMYVNGKMENQLDITQYTINNAKNQFTLGKCGDSNVNYFNGNIDEFRFSKGIARWTDNFTSPTGEYLSINKITLNKATDELIVDNIDQLIATITPDNVTNKTVTWTSDKPEVATVDSTGKVTAIKEGTATITATTTDGSNLNATCTVTVTPKSTTTTQPTDNTGNAILTITMTNGNVKSYTVPMTKVNDFISWYDNRVSGSAGKAYYTFDKTDNLQPFSKKTEYIIFDKISSYEVDEYSK